MMFDDKTESEMIHENEPGVEREEPPLCRLEMLRALIDAAKSHHYIDWAAFTEKPRI